MFFSCLLFSGLFATYLVLLEDIRDLVLDDLWVPPTIVIISLRILWSRQIYNLTNISRYGITPCTLPPIDTVIDSAFEYRFQMFILFPPPSPFISFSWNSCLWPNYCWSLLEVLLPSLSPSSFSNFWPTSAVHSAVQWIGQTNVGLCWSLSFLLLPFFPSSCNLRTDFWFIFLTTCFDDLHPVHVVVLIRLVLVVVGRSPSTSFHLLPSPSPTLKFLPNLMISSSPSSPHSSFSSFSISSNFWPQRACCWSLLEASRSCHLFLISSPSPS